jgi:hypothetical protein
LLDRLTRPMQETTRSKESHLSTRCRSGK